MRSKGESRDEFKVESSKGTGGVFFVVGMRQEREVYGIGRNKKRYVIICELYDIHK